MSNIYIGNCSLYFILFNFLIFSFLGWLMETIRVSIRSGCYVNRGFAEGPYCPIYGFGMVFIIIFLTGFKENIPLLFIFGILLSTTLEYITAWLLEIIFKAKWWDYSYKKFNYKGRICLDISIAWGFLAVVMIELVVPVFEKLLSYIPVLLGEIIIYALLLIMAIDVVRTGLSILSFHKLLLKMAVIRAEIKQEWSEFSEDIKDNVRDYIEGTDFGEKLTEMGLKRQELQHRITEKAQLLKNIDVEELKKRISIRDVTDDELSFINRVREKYARYAAISKLRVSRTHRRIMRAYPGFRIKNEEIQDVLRNIKDKIKKYG